MIRTLLKNSNFNGKYVTMKDFSDYTVIANGITPQESYEKSSKKERKNPRTDQIINVYGFIDTGADECTTPARKN